MDIPKGVPKKLGNKNLVSLNLGVEFQVISRGSLVLSWIHSHPLLGCFDWSRFPSGPPKIPVLGSGFISHCAFPSIVSKSEYRINRCAFTSKRFTHLFYKVGCLNPLLFGNHGNPQSFRKNRKIPFRTFRSIWDEISNRDKELFLEFFWYNNLWGDKKNEFLTGWMVG